MCCLTGALAAVAIGYAPLNWSVLGEPVIALISIFEGAMLYLAGSTNDLWVTYICYMAFNITYSVLITIARYFSSFSKKKQKTNSLSFHSSEVAKGLKQEAYGLVFGINTFMALAFQTILTLIVADSVGLALEPQDQVFFSSSKA